MLGAGRSFAFLCASAPLLCSLGGCGGSGGSGSDSTAPASGVLVVESYSPASDSSAPAGEPVLFQVGIRGTGSYEWTLDGALQSSSGPDLLLETAESDAGDHTVVVTIQAPGIEATSLVWRLQLLPPSQYVNRPPVIEGESPPGAAAAARGDPIHFLLSVSDPDAGDQVTCRWSVDGVEQTTHGASFRLDTWLLSAATHQVEAAVDDGHARPTPPPSRQWTVTVLDEPAATVNGPPVIESAAPPGRIAVPAGTRVNFEVMASDPEGDPLRYLWKVDGAAQPAGGSTFSYRPHSGLDRVEVRVEDGIPHDPAAIPFYVWSVTAEEDLPVPTPDPFPIPAPGPVLRLSWDPVTTDIEGNPLQIAGYRIYAAESGSPYRLAGTTSQASAELGTLSSLSVHVITVKAFDLQDTESAFSAPITVLMP